MPVISISITESKEQIVSGIPRFVTITANIPSLIFYTIDGEIPTVNSQQYVGPITLPTSKPAVILSAFASNGICSSPIISETYQTNRVSSNVRFSHNDTDTAPDSKIQEAYPYGNNGVNPDVLFKNPADVGKTADNPQKTSIPTQFDGSGNVTGFTNNPYNSQNYDIIYSTQDAQGRENCFTGNMPAKAVTEQGSPIPEETYETFTGTFDPRALVIFQDASKENPNDPPSINREHIYLQNDETIKNGSMFYVCGWDSPPANGAFVRSFYNPRDNTITYYYFDSWACRWLISRQPYVPTGTYDGNLSGAMAMSSSTNRVIYPPPFFRRTLF